MATSLIPADALAFVTGFAASIVPTVMAILAILVPAGLGLWAISFAVKKGLNYLKKNANKTV